MKTQTKTSTPEPIVFRQNVMLSPLPGDPLNQSRIIEAGKPSPWTDVSQVPERLRGLIGVPDFSIPKDTETQRWVPRAQLEAEAEAFRRLNSNEDMSESLREELDARGREYLKVSAQRNATETAIENREEADRRRLIRELEEENRRKLGGKI